MSTKNRAYMMSSNKRFSTIAHNYPSFQDINPMALNPIRWMESRNVDDKAENLWRLNDTLYDLTDFIKSHPGGSDWIKLTKGTDITEAFETHHIYREKPESLLHKYKIRMASGPRNFKFTFDDNGFYRTFKRKAGQKLQTIDRSPEQASKYYIDGFLFMTFVTAIFSIQLDSTLFTILASLSLNYTTICAHNFLHQKDNFRMYYFNLSSLSYRDWRVQHAISHHLYPNSVHDLEMKLFEPFLCWTPNASKNVIQRYGSWLYSPVIYAAIFIIIWIKRLVYSIVTKTNMFHKDDIIPFSLPLAMYLFGQQEMAMILKTWLLIISISSFFFGIIGKNAGHHDVHNVHEGDNLRSNMDWGIYTLDTLVDNSTISHNHFASLTHFGNHIMHHLLPTIDHGIAKELYSILFETMADFETDFEEYPWFFHIIGQHKQLVRNTPSTHNPIERKKMRIKEQDLKMA